MFKPKLIEGPAIAATPAEAKAVGVFSADDNDAYIETMLAIAQSEIDGWDGWLGRAIGEQTLEVTVPGSWEFDEDCLLGPFIEEVSDVEQSDGTRKYQYKAGYQTIPPAIKHAIILMAAELSDAVPDEGGLIKRETIDGIGSQEFSLPDGAAASMRSAAGRLLERFWVPAV